MELYIFGRFHARAGRETELAAAIRESVESTREEPGCLEIRAFGAVRDSRLFFIHARFVDEDAFELHAALPRVVAFIERAEALIDHPLDVSRTTLAF